MNGIKFVDKKIKKYLDRARKISNEISSITKVKEETFEGYFKNVIEIAKMIQREELK